MRKQTLFSAIALVGVLAGCKTTTSTGTAKQEATTRPSASSPVPPAAPVVLLNTSGSGIQNSAPFTVRNSALTVTYSYDCSSFGQSGNFIADLVSGSPASLGYDDQSIANALGTGGSAVTTVYPANTGSQYHLSVDSECAWTVKITTADGN
jgi:hypothetical protein